MGARRFGAIRSRAAPRRGRPAGRRFSLPALPGAPDLRKLRRRLFVVALVVAALAAGYLFWLRDSSLVAVERVTVTGAAGQPGVEAALASAATEMTTLHVDEDALLAAVADMPAVLSLSAAPDFPHGLEVDVDIRRPVAYVEAGETILAGDGVVLETNAERPEGLPLIEAEEAPSGARAAGGALILTRVLSGAPEVLLAQATTATVEDDVGPVVEVGPGIELRFGDASKADLKWSAAAAVLADSGLDNAVYIDLAVPSRPVVG